MLIMNIVVCVKQVPDTWAEKRLDPSDRTLDRSSGDQVINELDEYAVEEALRLKEAGDGSDEVTVVTMGPTAAADALKKGLQMGADKAVHLVDDGLHGSDALATSYALAEVLRTLSPDLILFGSESTDARMSVVPAMVAERLQLPQVTFANKVEVDGTNLRVQRQTEYGYDRLEAALPAVVSVVEKINEPRYPSFKGIMAAKKKPLQTLNVADVGLDPQRVGLGAAWSAVDDFAARPPRSSGTVVTDEGDGGTKVAEFLAAQKFI
jgi:electron transfer flavoprotein beta subunit